MHWIIFFVNLLIFIVHTWKSLKRNKFRVLFIFYSLSRRSLVVVQKQSMYEIILRQTYYLLITNVKSKISVFISHRSKVQVTSSRAWRKIVYTTREVKTNVSKYKLATCFSNNMWHGIANLNTQIKNKFRKNSIELSLACGLSSPTTETLRRPLVEASVLPLLDYCIIVYLDASQGYYSRQVAAFKKYMFGWGSFLV